MQIFDIHIHSNYSDGVNSPEEIVRYAKKIGLSGIAITDHNEIRGSLKAMKFQDKNFNVIPGIEISAIEGHILALYVKEKISALLSAEETIEIIHKLGGIAIAAHPYDFFRGGVRDLIFKLKFDAIEIENGHTLYSTKKPSEIKKSNLPLVGGSDAHSLDEIGSVSILVPENENLVDAIKNNSVEILSKRSKIKTIGNFLKRRIRF
ncbi:MAG: PHP domain-containing protein [Candidatus Altiarchaeota archaeon]